MIELKTNVHYIAKSHQAISISDFLSNKHHKDEKYKEVV